MIRKHNEYIWKVSTVIYTNFGKDLLLPEGGNVQISKRFQKGNRLSLSRPLRPFTSRTKSEVLLLPLHISSSLSQVHCSVTDP